MITRDFKLEKEYEGYFYSVSKIFNGYEYLCIFNVLEDGTSTLSLSSGKKRKHLYIFEEKYKKNIGCGIAPLLWVKEVIKYYISNPPTDKIKNLIIGWSDSRRRNIYVKGLSDLGFTFSQHKEYGKVLKLKI